MDILFKQRSGADENPPLYAVGITNCYFKKVSFARDRSDVTRKMHFHTGFEIHIIEEGYQIYEINRERVTVQAGEFLIIPPLVGHTAAREHPDTKKSAISFCAPDGIFDLDEAKPTYLAAVSDEISSCLSEIVREFERKAPYYESVISIKVAEAITKMLRCVGIRYKSYPHRTEEDKRLSLAKQYIKDNLRRNVQLSELADYCCMSTTQLCRVFRSAEGISPAEYIRKKRCTLMEKLLCDPELSLREISERMGFNNEYYFNAFFKKYTGMTPGAYRRAVLKT